MPRHTIRRAQSFVVALATIALIACGKGDQSADTSAAPAAKALVAKAPPPPLPGALTKPIDDYTGDEFADFVQTLTFAGPHERDRRCKNAPGCGGTKPSVTTKVRVDAVAGQDSLVRGTVPQYGVVDVRAVNKGNAQEATYDMQSGGRFSYYLVVMREGDSLHWRLEELESTPGGHRHGKIKEGTFKGCNHPWTAGAKADFKSCQSAWQGDTVKLGLFQSLDENPIWVGCGMGCCVAEM